jgi:hypothetical protein
LTIIAERTALFVKEAALINLESNLSAERTALLNLESRFIEQRTVLLGLESNLRAERASLLNSQVQPILDLNQLVSEISDTSHSQNRLGKKRIKCKLLF